MTQTTAARPSLNDMTGKTYEGRQRQLIHVLSRALGHTDAEYRVHLRLLTDKTSAAELDRRDLAYVIDVFTEFLDAREAAPVKRSVHPKPGSAQYAADAAELEELLAVA